MGRRMCKSGDCIFYGYPYLYIYFGGSKQWYSTFASFVFVIQFIFEDKINWYNGKGLFYLTEIWPHHMKFLLIWMQSEGEIFCGVLCSYRYIISHHSVANKAFYIAVEAGERGKTSVLRFRTLIHISISSYTPNTVVRNSQHVQSAHSLFHVFNHSCVHSFAQFSGKGVAGLGQRSIQNRVRAKMCFRCIYCVISFPWFLAVRSDT
jgi:hypothetical protein